jgi:3-hydroxy-5-methyl-1-naphthoate 3-O-methyltransferase
MLPEELSQLVRGFQHSRIVLTAIELDVFTRLGDGASAGRVAEALGVERRGVEILLNALTALDLLTKSEGVFRNSEWAARYFDDASPQSERTAMMHTVNMWESWSRLTETITGAEREPDVSWTEGFIEAMARNGAARAPRVVEGVALENTSRLLDVGGGPGTYAIEFARATPGLQATIFDKEEVLPIARRHAERAGLEDRLRFVAGDFKQDGLGSDYDLVLLSNILHMLSPDECLDLLQRSADALGSGGRVVIQDFILDEDGTSPPKAAIFAINMLVATPGGSSYRESEYRGWLQEAGFQDVRLIELDGPSDLVIGRKA